MEQILALVKPLVEAYAGQFGVAIQIISIIGSLRLAIKPIMALVEAVVLITPSESDNDLPARIKENKIYKIVVFLFDWFASIKLPKK